MQNAQPDPFKIKRLRKRDLSLTVPPGLRNLPAHVVEEEMARRRKMVERFAAWSPRKALRMKHHVIGAMIFLPLFSWFLTPVGFARLWLQIPLAALFGAALAWQRGSARECMLLSLLYGIVHWFVVGGLPLSFTSPGLFLMMASTSLFWVIIGWALGATEDLNRHDGI